MDLIAHAQPSAASTPSVDLLVPVVLAGLATLAWSRRHRHDAILLMAAALATLSTAIPPLHDAAERSVTGHMVQHLVLIVVAAPCIGFAADSMLGGHGARRWVRRIRSVTLSSPSAPLIAGLSHALMLIAWHVPTAYDTAVNSWILHGVEHAALLGTGAWWWATVSHHCERSGVGAAVVSLFGVATTGAATGVLMMFAPSALYGQGGVADQQVSGALMAGGTGAVYAGTALWLSGRAIARLATPRPTRVPETLRRPMSTRGAATVAVICACLGASAALAAFLPEPAAVPQSAALPGPEPEDRSPGEQLDGATLYRRDCSWCHGPEGTGTPRGPSLEGVGTASATYMLETGRMPIQRPDAQIRRSDPSYTAEQIEQIVAHIDTLIDGPEAQVPDPDAGDLADGGVLYRLNCAACHGAEGIGGGLASDAVAPSLFAATPSDVANAVISGPGEMPSFEAALDDDELDGLTAYVQLLRDPPTTGLALPGGRVSEGLVAWLAGLLVIVLAARWIGSSA